MNRRDSDLGHRLRAEYARLREQLAAAETVADVAVDTMTDETLCEGSKLTALSAASDTGAALSSRTDGPPCLALALQRRTPPLPFVALRACAQSVDAKPSVLRVGGWHL